MSVIMRWYRLIEAPCPRSVIVRVGNADYPSEHNSSQSSIPDTLPVAAADTDWRQFRARLVASTAGEAAVSLPCSDDPWAHSLGAPESGCLLLASPMFFTHSQPYFNKAVILITEHGPRGSMGIILNKPLEYRVDDVNQKNALPAEYNPCQLYLGGDVNREAVTLVHGVPDMENCNEIVPGVYCGGLRSVAAALAAGEATTQDVKVSVGLCGWGPGQLQEECLRGVWMVAAASKHLILAPSAVQAGDELWHATLQMMGPEYAGLSAAVKETYRADIMGLGGQLGQEGGVEGEKKRDAGHNHGSGI